MTPILRGRAFLTLAIGLTLAPLVSTDQTASQQAPNSSVFRVRVLDRVTNEPMGGVSVYVRCLDSYPRSTRFTAEGTGVTDERGEVTQAVPEGGVCLVLGAATAGYGTGIDELTRPTNLEPGETVRIVRLWKKARLSGHVTEAPGRPVAGTVVRLVSGRPDGTGDWAISPLSSTTDSQGAFHFDSLTTTAAYSVSIPQFEVVQPSAPITLQPGEFRNVDLRVRPAQTFRVSGRITAPATSSASVMVSLDRGFGAETYTRATLEMRANADGRFIFSAVPRGDYRLRVDTGSSNGPSFDHPVLWANQRVSVIADIEDLSVPLARGPEVRGTIRFEGASAPPTTGRILLRLDRVDARGGRPLSSGMMDVDSSNHFYGAGMLPGPHVLGLALIPDAARWRLKDAMTRGIDMSSVPLVLGTDTVEDLVVTFTDRKTDLTGTVRDERARVDADASVLVLSTDEQFWADTGDGSRRMRAALTDQHGRYAVANLAPGEYFVVAVPTLEIAQRTGRGQDMLRDSQFLRQIGLVASRIRLEYDHPLSQDLKRVSIAGLPATTR